MCSFSPLLCTPSPWKVDSISSLLRLTSCKAETQLLAAAPKITRGLGVGRKGGGCQDKDSGRIEQTTYRVVGLQVMAGLIYKGSGHVQEADLSPSEAFLTPLQLCGHHVTKGNSTPRKRS